jgi:hypothetical protein
MLRNPLPLPQISILSKMTHWDGEDIIHNVRSFCTLMAIMRTKYTSQSVVFVRHFYDFHTSFVLVLHDCPQLQSPSFRRRMDSFKLWRFGATLLAFLIWCPMICLFLSCIVPSPLYRVFQKELYNFERVQKFIQRTYTTFWIVIL